MLALVKCSTALFTDSEFCNFVASFILKIFFYFIMLYSACKNNINVCHVKNVSGDKEFCV